MRLAGTRLKNESKRIGLTEIVNGNPVWNGQVRFNRAELEKPLRWRRPRKIFVCPHGDLFHEAVEYDWINRVLAVAALCPQHTFQILTKRAYRMYRYFLGGPVSQTRDTAGGGTGWSLVLDMISDRADRYWPLDFIQLVGIERFAEAHSRLLALRGPPPNVHLGVSVENQEWASERIPWLLQTRAHVHWISAEPLLGGLDLTRVELPGSFGVRGTVNVLAGLPGNVDPLGRRIRWVVAGGESGPKARPMHPEWARSLRDQCAEHDTAFFFKQHGEWAPYDRQRLPLDEGWPFKRLRLDGTTGPHGDDTFVMAKIGKKRAGRMLDGCLHEEYPA